MFKFKNGIFGFVLAAGLIAFACDQARSGVMIDNHLYTPLKIKLAVSYKNKSGGIKQMSITSKEIVKMLGYPKGSQLAFGTGNRYNDIFLINANTVLDNLSWTVSANELLSTSTEGKHGKFTYKSSGILSINLYSSPQLFLNIPNIPDPFIPNLNWQADSEAASDYWFEISGIYFYNEKDSAINGDKQNVTTSFKAGMLSGVYYDVNMDAPNPTTVTGNIFGSGSISIETIN